MPGETEERRRLWREDGGSIEMVVRGRQNNNLGRGVLSGAGSLVKTQTIFKRRPATAR